MSLDPRLLLLRARAVGVLADLEKAAKKAGKFDSVKHPRYPAGNPKGGQFRPKLGTGAGGAEIFMPVYTGSNQIIQSFEAATLAVANQMAQGILTGAQKLMGMKTHPDDTNNLKLKSTVRQLAAGVAKPDVTPTVAVKPDTAAPATAVGAIPSIKTSDQVATLGDADKIGRFAVLGKADPALISFSADSVKPSNEKVFRKNLNVNQLHKDGMAALKASGASGAIKNYIDFDYKKVNEQLSTGALSQSTVNTVRSIEKAANSQELPAGLVMGRAFGADDAVVSQLLNSTGMVLQNLGATSTSINPAIGGPGGKEVRVKITAAAGATGVYIGANKDGDHAAFSGASSKEREVLLSPSSRFLVLSASQTNLDPGFLPNDDQTQAYLHLLLLPNEPGASIIPSSWKPEPAEPAFASYGLKLDAASKTYASDFPMPDGGVLKVKIANDGDDFYGKPSWEMTSTILSPDGTTKKTDVPFALFSEAVDVHDSLGKLLSSHGLSANAAATGAKIDAAVTAATPVAKPDVTPTVVLGVGPDGKDIFMPVFTGNSKTIAMYEYSAKKVADLGSQAVAGVVGKLDELNALVKQYKGFAPMDPNIAKLYAATKSIQSGVKSKLGDANLTDATVTPKSNPASAATTGYQVKLLPETSGMNKLINAETIKVQALVDSGDALGLNSLLATAKHSETIKAIADAKEYLTTGNVTPATPTPAKPAAAIGNTSVISAPKGIGSKTHAQYTKQADAVYQSALAGDKAAVDTAVAQYQAKIDAAKLKPNYPTFADGQYNKLLSYSQKVQAEMQTAATAGLPATAPKSALTKNKLALAEMTQVGGKPGGSNPGGVYQDADGAKWLVKGSNKPDPNGGPAQNEVLAARLYNAAGGHAPEMRTVDMGTQYGGGIGVASKMQDGLQTLDVNNPAHVAKVREDFALDAWMANWDAVGLGMDNTVIDKNGNALRIDPGGSMLYRAQGEPKGADFGKTVNEWNTLHDPSKNPHAAKVFAGMTDSELKASAAKVAAISDNTIKTLVDRYGPGDAAAKASLVETMIARKQDVLAKAGMLGATAAAVATTPATVATPAAKPAFKLAPETVSFMSASSANKIEALANGNLDLAALSDKDFTRVADGLGGMDTAEINAWGLAVIGDQFKSLPGITTIDIPTIKEATALLNNMANADAFAVVKPAAKTATTPPVKPDTSALTAPQKEVFDIIDHAVNKVGAYHILTDQDVQDVLGMFATSTDFTSSPELKQYAQAWLDHLNAGRAAATATVTPVVAPTAVPAIKPALPNFNSYKLEAGNSNASGVNAKVDKIAALAQAGDVAGILALSYGSNTYAKKTVNLANDTLAALGSTATVTAGQKANSHPGISTAGTTPAKPAVPPATPATHTGAWANQYGAGVGDLMTRVTALGATVAAKAHFDPAKLDAPPDYANFHGPGKGLSSKAEKNAVSNQIAQELYVLAANGDLVALKNYDIAAQVGGVKGTVTESVVGAYRDQLIGQIDNMLNPPKPVQDWKIGGPVTPDNVAQTLQQAFPKYQQYQQTFQNKAQMIGRWGIQGGLEANSLAKVVAAADAIPNKTLTYSSQELQKIYEASQAKYLALPDHERNAIKSYTGGIYDTWNTQIATNTLSGPVKVGIRAYEKASVELPPGLVLSRKWDIPDHLAGQIQPGLLQSEGKVVQDLAMISSSIDPSVWHGEVQMRIKTLPGARGLYVGNTANGKKAISTSPSEKEIVFNSKTRFLVTKVSQKNYDSSFFGGKKNAIFMDVLALPEDPAGSVLDSLGGST